jgi:hypothetical protein
VIPEEGSETSTRWSYRLERVIEVEGRRGVATDGERDFVSGSPELFVRFTTGELLSANHVVISYSDQFFAPIEIFRATGSHHGGLNAYLA